MTPADPLAARLAALDLLEAVLRRNDTLDEALDAHPALPALDPRDRGFTRLLVATVLRRLGQIDAVIAAALARPDPVKAPVPDILRLGVAQLLFLDTPAHAAVDTAVALASAGKARPYKGLINAVLRRVAAEGPALVAAQDAGRLNTPDWLWLAWRRAWGTARTRALVEAHLEEAPLDITVKDDAAAWAGRLNAAVLPTGTLRRPAGGAVADLPGFAEGAWWVQDRAAALPALLLGEVRESRVIDLCAAPGGKTAQLAARGARVTALDRSAKRLDRLKANLDRLGLTAESVVADAATWMPATTADAVLLDAPCTATGTIRRHPDIQRLKRPEDVGKLAGAQRRLLAHAVEMVRPGGLIIFCTCSLQPEEGEARVAGLLASRAPVERLPIEPSEVADLSESITPEGDLRTLPGQYAATGGIDGFFCTRLRRLQ